MTKSSTLDIIRIREMIIAALASEDVLADQLVLKGGNALAIAYGVTSRASWDLDYSIPKEFLDLDKTRDCIQKALDRRFAKEPCKVIDITLEPKPKMPSPYPRWGGYLLNFKLVTNESYDRLKDNLPLLRKEAIRISKKKAAFKVDISRFEYVEGHGVVVIDSYDVNVYTQPMIAAEKLRALCQQLPEYEQAVAFTQRPRPRDFYDIHGIKSRGFSLSTTAFICILKPVFAAKEVPLALLGLIKTTREFHRAEWAAVENEVKGPIKPFDFYFDSVDSTVQRLLSAEELITSEF